MIRLNPDVIIYDDLILQTMMRRPGVCAVLANCFPDKYVAHTDFFAIQPVHISKTAFDDWKTHSTAEFQATRAFFEPFIAKNRAGWLIPQGNRKCRVLGNGLWHDHSDVWSSRPWIGFQALAPLVPGGATSGLTQLSVPKRVDKLRTCRRTFVSYESSFLEKSWLPPKEFCKRVSKWMGLTGPYLDVNRTQALNGPLFSSFVFRVRCQGEDERTVVELIEPLVSVQRCGKRLSVSSTLLSKGALGGERIQIFEFAKASYERTRPDLRFLIDEYEKAGFEFSSIVLPTSGSRMLIPNDVPQFLRGLVHREKYDWASNAWKFVAQKTGLGGFVAVKMGGDRAWLDQSVNNLLTSDEWLVNEVFFETSDLQKGTEPAFVQKLLKLRRKGIKAHAC